MNIQILLILLLNVLINIIATLSYSIRIVGIRTGRIAVSFALFNIFVLVSRIANGFQAPLLASLIEKNIITGINIDVSVFRLIIFTCTISTILGAFFIPSFHRLLSVAVNKFSIHKSIPKILFYSFTKGGRVYLKESLVIPSVRNVFPIEFIKTFPWKVFFMNVIAVSIITIGVISSLYAGYLNPEFRTTSSTLSSVINGVATILMFVFIDPFLSIMTDEVVLGKCKEALFRRYITYMVIARVIGTLIAQVIFLPAAKIISFLSKTL